LYGEPGAGDLTTPETPFVFYIAACPDSKAKTARASIPPKSGL
jgi:hypothetical protein